MKHKKIYIIALTVIVIFVMVFSVYLFTSNKSIDTTNEDTNSSLEDTKSTSENSSSENDMNLSLSGLGPPPLDNFLQSAPEKIGTPGVDFPMPETGEPTDWEHIPVPFINPLGSKALYDDVSHYEIGESSTDISYIDGTLEVTKRVDGETWELDIPSESNLTQNYIRWYAKDVGATLYDTSDDMVTFSIKEGNSLWWATAFWKDLESNEAIVTVVKQEFLPEGKTITITPNDLKDGHYYFHTQAGDDEFLSAIVEITGSNDAIANIKAFQYQQTGLLTREFNYRKDIEKELTQHYVLDDIPQTGEPLFWDIEFYSNKYSPESISFRIEKTGSLSPVNINDSMGSIKVIGATGSAKVSKQSALRGLEHQDGYSYTGISDSEGNTIFTLPAGYYNIHANLPGGGSGGIRMVPVNGGELTEVVLPDEFKSTYSAMETYFGDFATNKGSINIISNKDNGDTAEVAIMVNDPMKRDIFPEKKDIAITEGGEKGLVTDIKREPAIANVVLVIDTSGSMKDYMQATIDAAKKFVEGLPDGTNIRLLSFAQKLTEHSGSNKNAVLKSLDTLEAVGGTALYDAAGKGLDMLEGMDKAYLVLFSDGADSRELKNQGKGSTLTKNQIIEQIKSTDIHVLTIGFGKGQDTKTLNAMSDSSKEGAFFFADDETALDKVFAAVAGKFGNQFVITYNRPSQSIDMNAEKPVVGVMMDDSGSMNDYRDAAIAMFHDFFQALPENSLIQFSKFGDSVDMMHITTDKKANLMQAMGEKGMTGGGTDIILALNTAVDQLQPLPTNKKVLIFVTDEAMDEISYREDEAADVFLRIKEEGIRVLFVGVSNATLSEEFFQLAASKTGGDYIISDNIAAVDKKLDELLKKVSIPLLDEEKLPFTIGIKAKTDDGSMMDYFAAKKISGFSQRKVVGKNLELKTAKISTGGKMIPLFSSKEAAILSGGVQPDKEELVITGHVSYEPTEKETEKAGEKSEKESKKTGSETYDKKGKNSLVEITVKDAYTFDILNGLEAERDKQFLALNIDIDFYNNSAEQVAYMIPSILQHFYLSQNHKEIVPASKATWLAAEPITEPGNVDIMVNKGDKKSGILVFYTEKPETITQLSLHFYDTEYGHIHIPLTGKIKDHLLEIDKLPTSKPAKINDSFSMNITGLSDNTSIYDKYIVREDQVKTVMRTVEAEFSSKVQALLNIDPMERFYYGIQTDEGPLLTNMSNLVYNIPLGFTGNTMLAPGSTIPVRMPFEISEALANAPSFIYGDLKNDLSIDVTRGSPVKTSSAGIKFSHEYFDVTINSLRRSQEYGTRNKIILDITVSDKKDGYGTGGLNRVFALENIKATNEDDKYVDPMDTKDFLYGIHQDWNVFDNFTRRGILIFDINGDEKDYVLRSPYFPDMNVKIEGEPYAWPELLAKKIPVEVDTDFENRMKEAVSAVVARYKNTKTKVEKPMKTVDLNESEKVVSDLTIPTASSYGQGMLKSLKKEEDFYQLMYSLKWLPAKNYYYYYAPEAVITQSWGTEWDIAKLGTNALTRLGYKVDFKEVRLTKRGKEALSFLSKVKVDHINTNELPALCYIGNDGKRHTFVIPFMRDINELSGLVYLPHEQNGREPREQTVTMSITATVEGAPDDNGFSQSTFGAFAKAAGENETSSEKVIKEISLLEEDLSIPALSVGPIDIGYFVVAKSESGGDYIKAVVETPDGLIQGDQAIDSGKDKILSITVNMYYSDGPNDGYTHTTILEEGQKLTNISHTLAFNLPELTDDAIKVLEKANKATVEEAKDNVSNASKVRWYTRATLYRYLVARKAYDDETAQRLGLVMGRVNMPMAIMITAKSDGTNATASLDLMHHQNQILDGEEDQVHAYQLFSGMFASYLEGKVMADGNGVSLQQVWASLPKGTGFYMISDTEESRNTALEKMADTYPPVLLTRIQKAIDEYEHTIFIVPKAAGKAFDKPKWAWLEIDSETYEAISVFDTGERNGMASYVMGPAGNQYIQGAIGYFIGIDVATWSVAAYSLELEDYNEIKAAAEALCADILTQLEEVMSMAGDPKGYLGGKAKDQIKIGSGDNSISVSDIEGMAGDIGNAAKGEIDIPFGFAEGFQLAVKAYFGL